MQMFKVFSVPITKNTTYMYHKYTTKYHKYTTRLLQSNKTCDIVPQNGVFTMKCNILPHSVVFFKYNPTTNCSILLQNIVVYHKMVFFNNNYNLYYINYSSRTSTTEVVFIYYRM